MQCPYILLISLCRAFSYSSVLHYLYSFASSLSLPPFLSWNTVWPFFSVRFLVQVSSYSTWGKPLPFPINDHTVCVCLQHPSSGSTVYCTAFIGIQNFSIVSWTFWLHCSPKISSTVKNAQQCTFYVLKPGHLHNFKSAWYTVWFLSYSTLLFVFCFDQLYVYVRIAGRLTTGKGGNTTTI